MKDEERPLSIESADVKAYLEESTDVKAYLEVKTLFRLHDGVHIQNPNGEYQYFKFPFEGRYKVIIEKTGILFKHDNDFTSTIAVVEV